MVSMDDRGFNLQLDMDYNFGHLPIIFYHG